MSFEQPPVELGRRPERGLAKPSDSVRHVEHSLGRRYIQYSDQPRDWHVETLGNSASISLINHEEIGIRALREPYRFSLAAVEIPECFGRLRIHGFQGPLRRWSDIEPGPRFIDPAAQLGRSVGMGQLVPNSRRNKDGPVECLKKICLSNQDEIAERRGVANDGHSTRNDSGTCRSGRLYVCLQLPFTVLQKRSSLIQKFLGL